MAGAFLYDDRVRLAAVSSVAGSQVATMPLSNLADAQPRMRARWAGSAAAVLADFGADTAIEGVALLSTTLRATDTVRWRLGALEGVVEAAPVFDLNLTAPASLVTPAGWAFNRASLGWCFDQTGQLVQVASDQPRFDYDPATLACRGLLLEEARTNAVRNPRAEGATPGTPGTAPTNWAVVSGFGLASTVVGTGREAGIDYCDIRIFGTTIAGVTVEFWFETTTGAAAAVSQIWSGGVFARLMAGSFGAPFAGPYLRLVEHNAGGTLLGGNTGSNIAITTGALATQRSSYTATLSQATTAFVRPGLSVIYASGVAVDFTIRLGTPQAEQGRCISSPILPAVGVPGFSARSADQTRITGLSIGAASLLVQCQAQVGLSSPITVGGFSPNNDFSNASYLTIDTAGTCSWIYITGGAGLSRSLGGANNAATILLGANSATSNALARNGALSGAALPFVIPAAIDRVTIGGTPWGGPSLVGIATGVGTYQRVALYGSKLLDTQLTALSGTGSSLVAAAVAHDSGVVASDTSDAAQGNVIMLRSSAASGRYLRVDVSAPGLTAIDIGRLVAGPLWRLSRAVSYGVQEGREMLDQRDRNLLTAAEFPRPALVNPRITRFSLAILSSAEIRASHRAMLAAIGAAGEALWVPEVTLSAAELNARSLWGAIATPGEESMFTRDTPAGNARSFRIVERV